jgi:hypothetical protein
MQSEAKAVPQYLEELPEDRRAAIAKVRSVLRKHLPKGIKEEMGYGMIGYVVPHSIYPAGYHCDPQQPLPFVSLASQKNYMALYVMSIYTCAGEENWLRDQFKARGKKLDMGKCCIRFRKLEDLPLDVIAELMGRLSIEEYIKAYEAGRDRRKKK